MHSHWHEPHSAQSVLLTFSGHPYGYNVNSSRPYDLDYPSSVIQNRSDINRGVTMYYFNPSINKPETWKTVWSRSGTQTVSNYGCKGTLRERS
ncbi:MAG: hypothetical protein M1296_02980 [Chloroflexi bacterium]|nr:hypothetical protein [Chloroflexota bacterium]